MSSQAAVSFAKILRAALVSRTRSAQTIAADATRRHSMLDEPLLCSTVRLMEETEGREEVTNRNSKSSFLLLTGADPSIMANDAAASELMRDADTSFRNVTSRLLHEPHGAAQQRLIKHRMTPSGIGLNHLS